MDFIYIFIGIFVILPLAQYLILTIKLYGTQLIPTKLKPLASSVQLPKATEQQFNHAQKSLQALGFEFFDYIIYRDIIASSKPTIQLLMHHPEHSCYVLIANPHNPDLSRPYAYKFQSFTDQLTIEAMDADAEGVMKVYEPLHAFNLEANNHQAAFEEFLSVRKKLTKKEHHFITFQDTDSYTKHMQHCYAQYLRFLYHHGWVKKSNNALQLHFLIAVKLAWQIFKNSKKPKVLSAEETNEAIVAYPFLPQVQAQAHRQVQNNQQASQLGRWGKTLLFFGSALAFALLFGIAWSPFLVLILIPVLLFHELGHYLAMKTFGYRDLQILFLPIGAMVSGNKKQPTAMQSTLVSLAGPVPGLLLAFVLAVWAPDFIVSEYGLSLVFMLLIINYLNLLPFMPLDGGHVVNQLLFDRWPFLQFVLLLISVLIFALGAWAWSDPILTVLAIIFGLGLKSNFQQAQWVIQARKKWGTKLKNQDNISVVYQMMEASPAPFNNKYQDAITINERLSNPSPSLRDSLLGMAMYLTALLAPLFVVQQVIGIDLFKFLFTSDTSSIQHDEDEYQQWNPSYWQHQFNQAANPNDKKHVVQQALKIYKEADDMFLMSEIYPQAIELYNNNQWQNDADYPVLLQAHLIYKISEDHEYDSQSDLQQIAAVSGADSITYAEALVYVMSWQSGPDNKEQLLDRLDLLKTHEKYQVLFDALAHLHYLYEEEEKLETFLDLLSDYLPLFKSKAPEIYPSLQQYHYETLFSLQYYQAMLDMADHESVALSIDSDYVDTRLFELLAWSALLDHQYQIAENYQQMLQQAELSQQQALKDELGYVANLILAKQIDAIPVGQDPLFKLALAMQKEQPKKVSAELSAYINYIENSLDQPFSEYLKRTKHFINKDSKQLIHIKHQFLYEAILNTHPNLIDEIDLS